MRCKRLFPWVMVVLMSVNVFGEDSDVFTLGQVEVLGDAETRPVTSDSVDEKEMRQFNRDTVSDALSLLPGVSLSRTGARNEQTVYVRGFDIKHVPLFIDGIPVYVMYDGYPDLGRFYTYDLSQLVLSKGFASVLYGPNTMGGAINMVSRRPEKPFEMTLGAGAADGDTVSSYVNLGSRQDNWYIQAGGSYVDQDYVPMSSDFRPTAAEDGDRRENSYHTDWKANMKIGYIPRGRDDDEYALSYIRQEGEKGSSPYAGSDSSTGIRYWQWPQWDKESYYFTSRTGVGDTSYLKLRLYYDKYQNSLFSYDDETYTAITRKYAFRSWYDDHTVGGSMETGTAFFDGHDLKASLHYKRDTHKELDEGEPWLEFIDDIVSFGMEDTMVITDTVFGVVGASYDTVHSVKAQDYDSDTGVITDFSDSDAYGVNVQAGLFYDVSETGKLHATVARKTRLPDIKSRYSYRLGRALPNPDLDPEQSMNYEIGYEDTVLSRLQLKTAVFVNDIKDYIQFVRVPDPDDPTALLDQNRNIGKVMTYGAELGAGFQVTPELKTGVTYTYTEWDNRGNSDKITNIPEHTASAYAAYTLFTALTLQADTRFVSSRYSSSDGVRKAGDYTLVNAKATYAVTRQLTVEAGVNNIADEAYEIEEGYPEAGITWFGNLVYRY